VQKALVKDENRFDRLPTGLARRCTWFCVRCQCENAWIRLISESIPMFFFFILVYYIICSYNEESQLYGQIYNYTQSTSIVFIFLRWSPHFASFYTAQFLPNTASQGLSYTFSILHLLPIDIGSTSSFNEIVLNYEQQILANPTNITFSDDVRMSNPFISI
jgi:hypothetical protein